MDGQIIFVRTPSERFLDPPNDSSGMADAPYLNHFLRQIQTICVCVIYSPKGFICYNYVDWAGNSTSVGSSARAKLRKIKGMVRKLGSAILAFHSLHL